MRMPDVIANRRPIRGCFRIASTALKVGGGGGGERERNASS